MTTKAHIHRERYTTRDQGQCGGYMLPSPLLSSSVAALCALMMHEKRWGGGALWEGCVPTQRGGGSDHLDKVQQKSVQTGIFPTPWAYTTRKGTHSSYNAEVSYESMLCTYGLCSHESCVFSVANRDLDLPESYGRFRQVTAGFATPGAIVTHLVTLTN